MHFTIHLLLASTLPLLVAAAGCSPDSGATGWIVMLYNHDGDEVSTNFCTGKGGQFTLHNTKIGCTVTGTVLANGQVQGCNHLAVPKGQPNYNCGSLSFNHCGGGDFIQTNYNSPEPPPRMMIRGARADWKTERSRPPRLRPRRW